MRIDDSDLLADALNGTPLGGRDIATWHMTATGEALFSIDVDEQELVPMWSAARDLIHVTGRYPFAGNAIPREPLIELDAIDPEVRAGTAADPVEGLTRAGQIAQDLRDARRSAWPPWGTLTERVERHLKFTRQHCGIAPTVADVLDQLPPDAEEEDIERLLLEWEERHAPDSPPPDPWYLNWFFDGPTAWLLFAPTGSGPCSVLYSILYFVEAQPGLSPQRLVGILDAWREAYGAEVVANWGTMLQLLVSRPPRTLDEAWPLAIQHDLVAQNTLSGQTIRDHARNLIDRPSWFLHARP
jgi:hypothetical protein